MVFQMSNQTKLIIFVTFIMMVVVYNIGMTEPGIQKDIKVVAETDETENVVSDVAVRIRIIPNSNKYEDQQAKKMVKYAIDEFLTENAENLTDLVSTREFIAQEVTNLENRVDHVLSSIQYKEGFNITYGAHLFPEKVLDGVVYEEGYYESLVITLGEGGGSNWWCFMNPGLCLGPSMSESESDDDGWNGQYTAMESAQES
ncbi:MAG TPA: stage II sporulation protein R, partial [Firmicutes bacterium]|nr:stage II sporulation protein R [Bacillota bacterium]